MTPSREQLLSSTALFSEFDEGELHEIAIRCRARAFASGEMIVEEGKPSDGLYILADGTVSICRTGHEGGEAVSVTNSAPAAIAELPVFDGGPYPASVCATTPVSVYFIPREQFEEMCNRYPAMCRKVLASVGRRLRELMERLDQMGPAGTVSRSGSSRD